MARYQTKITKARFVYSPFTGQQMAEIGQSILDTIGARMDRALDVNDSPAPPLSPKYATFKQRRYGRQPIRDLFRTGRLRRSLKVLAANENKVVLGPTDGIHTRTKRGRILSFSEVLTLNQYRSRMWGVSPAERSLVVRLLSGARPIRAVSERVT